MCVDSLSGEQEEEEEEEGKPAAITALGTKKYTGTSV